jgi:hypothetical protein
MGDGGVLTIIRLIATVSYALPAKQALLAKEDGNIIMV